MPLMTKISNKAGVATLGWIKTGDCWLRSTYGRFLRPPVAAQEELIEHRATETNAAGPQPLLDAYQQRDATRTSDQVRTARTAGRFYADLARRRPGTIVEFGSAFGVSGMYWLAGLEAAESGRLLSFEPNKVWAGYAEKNIAAVGSRYEFRVGTFEDEIDSTLRPGERIDIAFIDAIHASAFVEPQFELVMQRLAPQGIVVLDDVDFSDDMADCWQRLSRDSRLAASFTLNRRIGVAQAV